MKLAEVALFLRQAIAEPRQVGGVFPSSQALANAMAAVTLAYPGPYAEFGPGTGRVTDALIAAGVRPEDLTSFELSPDFAARLRKRHPTLRLFNAPAQTVADHFNGQLGAVVSGLPLLSMPDALQEQILRAAFAALRPDGVFVQYTYGPRPSVAREVQRTLGLSAERGPLVLGNLPPARVYVFRRSNPQT
jgi:phosphatidylethanolamine/phosphatidyl-N-methylethanolamine N-methyltransferase